MVDKNKTLHIVHLGLIDYQKALYIQEAYYRTILAIKQRQVAHQAHSITTPNYLLFCQHFPVYTLGNQSCNTHLRVDDVTLKQQGIALCPVNRGGAITYHGPGQLVVYLILDLENFFKDIYKFMRLLEEAVIDMLKYFHIFATKMPGLTGVWLEEDRQKQRFERKICAIGLKISRWITMHGLALNVNNDLAPFEQIMPCGLNKPVTSMQQELNRAIPIEQVMNVLQTILLSKLGCDHFVAYKV